MMDKEHGGTWGRCEGTKEACGSVGGRGGEMDKEHLGHVRGWVEKVEENGHESGGGDC